MGPEERVLKVLEDVQDCASFVIGVTGGRDLADYLGDRLRDSRHDLDHGKRGNLTKHFERSFDTDEDVVTYFREQGFDFDRAVEACRRVDESVPRVENLITSEWTGGAPPGV